MRKMLIIGGVIAAAAAGVGFAGMRVAALQRVPQRYVALGDSVAAGAGLVPYGTGAADAECLRSPQSYPGLLAAKLGTAVTNLACSGAKTSDGLIGAQTIAGTTRTVAPQLDQAFANGTPDLITITIGANDVRWVQFIGKCYVATCGTALDTASAAAYLTYLQGKLAYTLHEIKHRSGSGTPPKVLITGYYDPISSTACTNGTITTSELRWINGETANLNKAISQTVAEATKISSLFKGTYHFATYVPVSFAGHGLCSADPWVQGQTDAAPLHPTAIGESQIAAALYQYAR